MQVRSFNLEVNIINNISSEKLEERELPMRKKDIYFYFSSQTTTRSSHFLVFL